MALCTTVPMILSNGRGVHASEYLELNLLIKYDLSLIIEDNIYNVLNWRVEQ